MPSLRVWPTAVASTVIAIAVLLLPTTASAASVYPVGYKVVAVTNQAVPAGQTAAAVVSCPAGAKPLGGGVYAGSDDVRVVESFPLGAPTSPSGWFATVANEGSNDSIFDVYAICAKVPRQLHYEVVGVTNQAVPAGQTAAAVVSCPAGAKPLGGGVYAGSDDVRVVESFPLGAPTSPSGWFATVANEGSNDSIFDVYAICAKVPRQLHYEVVGVTNQAVPAGQTAAAVVSCPAGAKPLGGGVYAGSDDVRVVESFPLGAPTSPSGWFATVANEGSNDSVFDVYAICARRV